MRYLHLLILLALFAACGGKTVRSVASTNHEISSDSEDQLFSSVSRNFRDLLNRLNVRATEVKHVFGYRPDAEAWLLIDRNQPNHFVALNLNCPSINDWKCEPLKGPARALDGLSPSRFLNPIVFNNYEYYFRLDPSKPMRDSAVQEILSSNNDVKLAWGTMIPWDQAGIASSRLVSGTYSERLFLYTQALLHEGFHIFVQFKGAFRLGPVWNGLSNETDRDNADKCFPRGLPETQAEVEAAKQLLEAIASSDRRTITSAVGLFLNAKERRLKSVAESASGVDCRKLDSEWTRTEGIPDYAALRTMMNAGAASFENVIWLYTPFFSSANTGMPYFYVEGSIMAFALDALDASQSWQTEISQKGPAVSLSGQLEQLAKASESEIQLNNRGHSEVK